MEKDQLSPNERARYARHIILPDVGEDGQKALRNSSVMVIGAGGLDLLRFYILQPQE